MTLKFFYIKYLQLHRQQKFATYEVRNLCDGIYLNFSGYIQEVTCGEENE